MCKELIQYERMDHLLVIATGGAEPIWHIKTDKVLQIRYSDYVKSQLHLNIVSDLFNRSSMIYKNALDYINGDNTCESSAETVLQYFYEDILNFLLNNTYNIKLEVQIDTDFSQVNEVICNYRSNYERLQNLIQQKFDTFEDSLKYLKDNYLLNNVVDYYKNTEDLLSKPDSYCAIGLLANYKNKKFMLWEVTT